MAATNEDVDQRLVRLNALKRSVARGDFVLQFQPRLDLKNCRIRAAEALIRWPEPGGEAPLTEPDRFFELARDGDLMEIIGKWSLLGACKANKTWQNSGLPFLRLAVNVPGELIAGGELAALVDEALRRSELDAAYLEIDVDEATAIRHLSETARAFEELRDMGVETAIDGFGAGGSTVHDICMLAPARVKTHPDHVRAIGADPLAGQTVRAAAVLAGGIHAATTAVGAETAEQIDFLQTLSIGEIQGFAFAEPMNEKQFRDFLDNFTEATLSFPASGDQFAHSVV